jgi:hypothetical protein
VHFSRKRIIHLVIEQVTAFFSNGDQLLYRFVFFFKTHCCHKFLPLSKGHPKGDRRFQRQFLSRDTDRLARRRS